MTAQQLSDRCSELGLPLHRSVIANLENGRRPTVSLAELLILARALQIAPLLLIVPLGRAPAVEIQPGSEFGTWDAALWISGYADLREGPDGPDLQWPDDDAIVLLFERHDQALRDVVSERDWDWVVFEEDPRKKAETIRDLETADREKLRGARAAIRVRGLMPPELPAELSYIDEPRSRERLS